MYNETHDCSYMIFIETSMKKHSCLFLHSFKCFNFIMSIYYVEINFFFTFDYNLTISVMFTLTYLPCKFIIKLNQANINR